MAAGRRGAGSGTHAALAETVSRVVLSIAGLPAPKGSRIAGTRKDGTIFTRPASKGEKPWRETVAYAARANGPAGKTLPPPYEIELLFSMPEPEKPKYRWPSKDGDLDKLIRAVLDGLTQGELIQDDRHVVNLVARKRFVAKGAISGVYVSIA